MNIGIITGEIIAHFVDAVGTKNVEINVKKNVNNTKTIPVNSRLLIQFVRIDTMNIPSFVSLNIKQNCAAKKINTNNDDRSFR